MNLLLELLDTTSELSPEIKAMKPHIDAIAKKLFSKKAGPVKDLKRSKDAKYFGVAHTRSNIIADNEKALMLTFDNSTDSGEFEINSLAPLNVVKGSDKDRAIKKLYHDHEIKSKKRTNYIVKDADPVLREVHLGKEIDKDTVRFVVDLLKILNDEAVEELKEGMTSLRVTTSKLSGVEHNQLMADLKKVGVRGEDNEVNVNAEHHAFTIRFRSDDSPEVNVILKKYPKADVKPLKEHFTPNKKPKDGWYIVAKRDHEPLGGPYNTRGLAVADAKEGGEMDKIELAMVRDGKVVVNKIKGFENLKESSERKIEVREEPKGIRVYLNGSPIPNLVFDIKVVRNAVKQKLVTKGTYMYDNMLKNLKAKLADGNLKPDEIKSVMKEIEDKI